MRSFIALSCVALCVGASPLAAWAQQQPSPESASLPSVTLPPELDRVLRDYERAWRARNADSLVALFTDDGFVMQPGRAPVRGKPALLAAYQGQGGPLDLRALAYAASDSVAYIIGAFGSAGRQGDAGKFTLTLRRSAGGKWLIASDMDNSNR